MLETVLRMQTNVARFKMRMSNETRHLSAGNVCAAYLVYPYLDELLVGTIDDQESDLEIF